MVIKAFPVVGSAFFLEHSLILIGIHTAINADHANIIDRYAPLVYNHLTFNETLFQ